MQTEAEKREAARIRKQRQREKSHLVMPETVTPDVTQGGNVTLNVTPETVTLSGDVTLCHAPDVTPEVLGQDGQQRRYNPQEDGVDGWHTTDKGMRYILQDTGMGGMARRYSPGPRMFSYR